MSLLTDTDLENNICSNERWNEENKIHIYPYSEPCLTPVGYDLRVGNRYSSLLRGYHDIDDKISILPGDTVLIETLEKVGMPRNRSLSALVESMVSIVSKGLSHISTTIDADWNGPLLIAIHNFTKNIIELKKEQPFFTVVFFENKSPSTREWQRDADRGRADILLKNIAISNEILRKHERRKGAIKISILIGILLLTLPIGYYLFGNGPGIIALVALGGYIGLIINSYILKD
jgi:deoxycytidine triphosphate deaminase